MPSRTISRFTAPRGARFRGTWARLLQRWGGALLTAVASAALAYLLLLAPRAWRDEQKQRLFHAWNDVLVEEPDAVERLLLVMPAPSSHFPAEVSEVRSMLEAHPTLEAVVRRGKPMRAWVRDGDGLVDRPGPLRERYLRWAAAAEAARTPRWYPTAELDPDAGTVPSLVLVDSSWIFIKRWTVGSNRVERHLRLALGHRSRVRVGVRRFEPEYAASPPPPGTAGPAPAPARAFEVPNLQTWPDSAAMDWNSNFTNTVLGPDWMLVFQPWPDAGLAWDKEVRREGWKAWALASGVALSLVLGLWLRHGAKRRQLLEADRMVSLLHSLKTPLALHKLRCDSLRMGRLSLAAASEELMLLGQDVDDLTCLIERGLQSRKAGDGDLVRLGPDWLRALAEEFDGAFKAAGRALDLELAEASGLAHEASLRSAVQTLLENAYYHGQGNVLLKTWKKARSLCIQVHDEGPGFDQETLAALGTPYLRLGDGGQEGQPHGGQGLGLHLLFQMARQEGWGLELESQEGRGLAATLQIPA